MGKIFHLKPFLKKINISEEDYTMGIRSSISTTTIFLKRTPLEIRINNYNSLCLEAWKANMDLQFIIDVYACAIYIASYITKTQRGMSELLRNACKEANTGNKTIKEQVRVIGNKFLNSVEISAQEACYLTLQLPLKRSSRQIIFINTSPPEERVILLKPQSQLQNMDDEDEDIECKGLIPKYRERPKSMEKITLAEFASIYEKKSFTERKQSLYKKTFDNLLPEPPDEQNEDSEDNDESPHDQTEDNTYSCQPSTSNEQTGPTYRKRNRRKIIRTVHFNQDVDTENYYRELLMLYIPWRDEETDLVENCTSFKEQYQKMMHQIQEKRKEFELFHSAVELAENFHNIKI